MRLAFDFARLEEQNESKQPKGSQTQDQTNAPSQYQRLIQAAAKADQQVEQSQNELQSLRQKLEATPEKKRPALESLIAETQSELALRQAHRDALRNILQFATGTSTDDMGAGGLRAQIEELARSVPSALSGAEGDFSRAKHYGTDPLQEHLLPGTGNSPPGFGGSPPTCCSCPAKDTRWISRSNRPISSCKLQSNCVGLWWQTSEA